MRPLFAYIIMCFLVMTACQQGVNVSDSKHELVQSGSTFSYVVVRLEFISELKQICVDANPLSKFPSEEEQKRVIAECTIERLSLIDINPEDIADFTTDYCGPNADLSGLTPEQVADAARACLALGL